MSHSLPAKRHMANFDPSFLDKPLTIKEIKMNPSLRAYAWDRRHDQNSLEKLKQIWQVKAFIIGHEAQEDGFGSPVKDLIVLASDHNHGCFLPFDIEASYSGQDLLFMVQRLAKLA